MSSSRTCLHWSLTLLLLGCSPTQPVGGAGGGSPTIPGCEGTNLPAAVPDADAGLAATPVINERTLFDVAVAPHLSSCRPCHSARGLADREEGRDFQLTRDTSRDYDRLRAAWVALGRGVETSPILVNASGSNPDGHTGGTLWPKNGTVYEDAKILLTCWTDPAACSAALATRPGFVAPPPLPLLGDLTAAGGRNYAAVFCEDKPDCASLPMDPRELISGENIENPRYAVYYNDPFEICETEALFENQARGNAILKAQGKEPAYTAKRRPKNCGEWRAAVDRGREYIVSNPITGAVLTVSSLINIVWGLELPVPEGIPGTNAAVNKMTQERYGWVESPYRNPAPLLEDPNQTNGGVLQLPLALTQVKDDEGRWTGRIGVTCFACHAGQIGTGEVVGNSAARDGHPELYGGFKNGLFVGLNGSNTDASLAFFDTERFNGIVGPDSFDAVLANPSYLAGRTRGTNAADQEVVNLLVGRDFDTLDWRSPEFEPQKGGKTIASLPKAGGDQDVPTWWWTHNKSRYLWVGYGSSGSSRGNFFPASTNPFDGHWSKRREGDFQDMDVWLNTVEAPKFVGPAIDVALAEQGALLFHTKDLWADPGNADIPRPGGNGSCAGCHGAYSPRFIHQPGFLPDARLAGTVGYTVPIEIVGTDPAQSTFFSTVVRGERDALGGFNALWMSYPDAIEGYRMPEERAPGETPFPPEMGATTPGRKCGLGAKGGYTAQPLHGVWASGPYFHNGSVPTVWDVLSPATRPKIWRRQRVPEGEATPGLGDRGFDSNLSRAYDHEKLGWKYEVFTCDPNPGAPYHASCGPDHDVSTAPGSDPTSERTIYNTHAYSKGNGGHAYTKVLTDAERRALVEYLKTL